jgi:hypothetical protein
MPYVFDIPSILALFNPNDGGFVRLGFLTDTALPGPVGQSILDHLIASGRLTINRASDTARLGDGVPVGQASGIPVLPALSLQSVFWLGIAEGGSEAIAVVCGGTTFKAIGVSFVFGAVVQEIPLPTDGGAAQFEIVHNANKEIGQDPTLAKLEADAVIFKLLIIPPGGSRFILSVRYARAKSAIIYYRFFSVETV